MNLVRGISNLAVALRTLSSAEERAALQAAWRIERRLPGWFARLSLPELMLRLDAEISVIPSVLDAPRAARLADAAVGLDCFSPLGICLRRSLVRYVLLRRAGLPVVVQFGAKKYAGSKRSHIAGHAWLTLNGAPHAEVPRDYAGFTPIYAYPPTFSDAPAVPLGARPAISDGVRSNLKSKI
jgi:transglutaminase superfamily protein